MDEKINEKLKEIYDSLTDEQKEKAKNCRTLEELVEFAGEEDIELPEELMDQVAGGIKIGRPESLTKSFVERVFCS